LHRLRRNVLTAVKVKRAIILDTSALLSGFDPLSIGEEQYTVPTVRRELRENGITWIRFKTAVENGRLKLVEPNQMFMDKVKDAAMKVGDQFFLSEVDQQILSLALQLKNQGYIPSLITDDYSIQNVADQLGVEFFSLATFGIRLRLKWTRYCPSCHKEYVPNHTSTTCDICGSQLRRKPKRKKLNQNNAETIGD
jgi:UPF0271 protein